MKILLLFLLVSGTCQRLYSQNVDILYVTKNKIIKEKGNFEFYYVIQRDPNNRFLYLILNIISQFL
jgi:hypothetical protein